MQEYSEQLPDFYSVRNKDQIDYSFEGMEGRKCFLFFDNGFKSSIIEPNNREMRFIWDGFYLFVDEKTTVDDLKNGIDLYDARLVALQRTSVRGLKSNDINVRNYLLKKLEDMNISYEIMNDVNLVDGYPTTSDLWSTRDTSVLIDAIDTVGEGEAYYYQNAPFEFKIKFAESGIPALLYKHDGALVLKGKDEKAISRLIDNDENLKELLSNIIKDHKIYSCVQDRNISGTEITEVNKHIR